MKSNEEIDNALPVYEWHLKRKQTNGVDEFVKILWFNVSSHVHAYGAHYLNHNALENET